MNSSVWRLFVLSLLNTTPSSHPYSSLIRLISTNSSLHSRMKRANVSLETSLHHPLPLPCHLQTRLQLHVLPASSVVDSTTRETATKSAKHLKLPRNSCKSASLALARRSRMQRKQRLLLSPNKGRLLKSNLLVMQVLSLHPLAPKGLNLVLALIGTPIQVHHHI